jgi:hypothetical protein
MPSPTYNDGTVQYGSKVLAILKPDASSRGNYVADNINVNRPTKAVDRTNEIGEPSGSVGIRDFETGSATIQLASSTAKLPINGDTFAVTFDTDTGSETWFLTSIGTAYQKDGETKVNITFKKKQN